MYTQCPECQIAFRVTAQVLQQAQGNVRCGSCGHAFNALHYLSEDMPDGDGNRAERDELAETSKRLLKTLDELAGPEKVRIEDTGVEWRVLGDEGPAASPKDERRYDDNSPLPEEYDDDDDYSPPIPRRRDSDIQVQTAEFDERQHDLALSEPEDWTDILEEVSDVDAFAVEEELVAIHNELASVDETPAETGIVMSDVVADDPDHRIPDADSDDSAALDVAEFLVVEPDDEDTGVDLPAPDLALTDEVPHLDESAFEDDDPIDDEESLIEEIEAVAVEIDDLAESGHDLEDPLDSEGDAIELLDIEDGNEQGFESEEAFEDEEIFENQERFASAGNSEEPETVEDLKNTAGIDDEHDIDDSAGGEFITSIDATEDGAAEDSAQALADGDDTAEDAEDDIDSSLALILDDDNELDEAPADIEVPEIPETPEVPEIPEPTEEEMTVNMEIDEQMMAAAQEDDEFSRTLVGMENPEELFNENAADVETIIMEGEFIRNEVEKERLAAKNAARSQLDDPARLADTYATSRDELRGGRRSYDPPAMGLAIAAAGLALLLAVQYIHNSRDSLATYGFFQQTVAPVYRVFGSPVTPAWDIKGWQFEATSGNVDEAETQLTIVSRIVNRSEQPLPFPLVHVSLTNRFEDVMGSRVLEPADYLPDDRDPSELVAPGVNFNAVIVIEQPSAEATGFKLNVCYRVEAGVVRCALEDFK